jgi:hypothetical protein
MKTMNAKSFWVYCLIGALGASVGSLILSDTMTGEALYPHPDYAEYERKLSAYEAWANDPDVLARTSLYHQRIFEEVLLGMRPPTDLPHPEFKEIIAVIEAVKKSHGPDGNIVRRKLKSVFIEDSARREQFRRWIKDRDKEILPDEFKGDLAALENAARLESLMKGQPDAIFASLPTMPAGVEKPASYPAAAPRSTAAPGWIPWAWWAILSGVFALGYTIAGLIGWSSESRPSQRGYEWSHPLAAHPNFAFGWLIKLLALPGFLVCHLGYLMTVDARPAVEAAKKKLFPKSFENEYQRFEAELDRIRERATERGAAELLIQIDQIREQVRSAENREHLGRLVSSLDNIKGYLEGMEELRREIPGV